MNKTDPILSRIREEAYAQATCTGVPHAPASPCALASACLGDAWLTAPHLELIDKELVHAANGGLRKDGYVGLIISVPPRHGKSTLVNQWFSAWYVGMHPSETVISVSYEADFAASWGREARDILTEHGRRLFGVTVRDDSSAASWWEIGGHGGGMMTAGVGGPLTGKGGRVLILDDFCKNAEEASSPVMREKWWQWYVSTFRTRLEPGGFIVIIATRWHEDDLIGRIIRRMESDPGADRFKVIRLPAVAEENDQLGRNPGAPLWPERYDLTELGRIRHTLGHRVWSALYQQSPKNSEGAMFRREQFHFVDTPPPCVKVVRFWDLAATQRKGDNEPDWTVGAKLGIDVAGRVAILDLRKLRGSPRQVDELVRRTAHEDGAAVLVRIEEEPGSASRIVVDQFRNALQGFDVQGVATKANKVSRAKPLSECAASGKLVVVRASWNAALLDELEVFPDGLHDDQVDACSGAFAVLGFLADAEPPTQAEPDHLRVEPLEYNMGLKLYRSWCLSGSMPCCVWFQVHTFPDGTEQVRVLQEAHSETEAVSDFVERVLDTTNDQFRCAQPYDVVIVPKIPMEADAQAAVNELWRKKVRATTVQWDPKRFNQVFGQKSMAGRISVNQKFPTLVHAIRASRSQRIGGDLAGDSFWEPLARTVKGGIAAIFTIDSSRFDQRVYRPEAPRVRGGGHAAFRRYRQI